MNDQEPRDLTEVIDRMLEVIPETPETSTLRVDLNKARDSAFYTAPELMKQNWIEARDALALFFGEEGPKTDWGKKVVVIFIDQE